MYHSLILHYYLFYTNKYVAVQKFGVNVFKSSLLCSQDCIYLIKMQNQIIYNLK